MPRKEFIYSIGDSIKLNKADIRIIEKFIRDNDGRKAYRYKCSHCGNIDVISEKDLIKLIDKCPNSFICNVCRGIKVLEGVNDIPTVAPWMIPYFQGGYDEARKYTRYSSKKIYPICPDCKNIRNKSISIGQIYQRKSISCNCRDGVSYPNKYMFKFLSMLHISFIDEYSPNWAKPYRYDFYIPAKHLIIEMDGKLGHGNEMPSANFGIPSKESLRRDKEKMLLAEEHGIKVIHIDAEKSESTYLSLNIEKALYNYFNMKDVDFQKCNDYALGNLAKDVCNYYKQHKQLSTIQIGKHFNLSTTSVTRYLKRGSQLGWCDYDVNKAKKEANDRLSKRNAESSKRVCVYDIDGQLIKIYDSCSNLIEKSIDDLGVYLCRSGISLCCNGKVNTYKNFKFSYID